MRRNLKYYFLLITLVVNISLHVGPILIRSESFIQVASAEQREFETNITVLANNTEAFDLEFTEGDKLDFNFSLQVKQDLPIDIWFVDETNYYQLIIGNSFLYFLNGSEEQIKQTTKNVSVTKHDTYKLVFINYNNESVEVNLKYDIKVHGLESEISSEKEDEWTAFWKSGIFLGLVALIFAICIIVVLVKKVSSAKKKPVRIINLDKKYLILKKIGQGGYSEVYRAKRRKDRLPVAIKVPFGVRDGDELDQKKASDYKKEIDHWFKLSKEEELSNGVVKVYEYGTSPYPWIVMELMTGNLRDRVKSMSIDEKIALSLHLLKVLARVHTKGIVHRDVKPENIMFNDAGEWKLGD